MMRAHEEAFFNMVRAMLQKHRHTPPKDVQKPLYRLAKVHELSAPLYPLLDRDHTLNEVHARFQRDHQHALYHASQIDAAVSDLKTILDAHKIPHVFLKGAVLRDLYPEPHMRTMGDVDVLVSKDHLSQVRSMLKGKGFALKHISPQHDYFVHPNGLAVEMHPTLYKEIDQKHRLLFEDEWQYTRHVDNHTYTLTHEFTLAYLLYHTIKHFYGAGVGYRFFLDMALYMVHHKESIELDTLYDLLQKGSMTSFFHATLWLNHVWFSIDPFPDIRKTHPLSEDVIERTTRFISDTGVHGSDPDFNRFEAQAGAASLQNISTCKFILRKVFLPYETMRGLHPWIRTRLLLPAGWMFRIVSKIISRNTSSRRNLKSLSSIKQQRTKTLRRLFEDIGL